MTSNEKDTAEAAPAARVTFHVAGDAYVDFFCFLDGDWPEHGGDSRLDQPVKSYAGGSSTNTATHLKSLIRQFGKEHRQKEPEQQQQEQQQPEPQVMLHTVLNPNDHYGQLLLQHSKNHNFPIINCRHEEDNASTGHCIAIVSGGERSFMTHQGCVGQFGAEDLQVDTIIATPTDVHLHVAGFFNIPGFWDGRLLERLQRIRDERTKLFPDKNTTISLVTQHDATRVWDGGLDALLPLLDFAIMNDLEANHITARGLEGKDGIPDDEIQKWAAYFGSVSPKTNVIVTRGEDGAVAFRDGKMTAHQAAKVVKPIDPTGAGDSFTAGYIHGIWSWRANQDSESATTDVVWPNEAIQEGLRWGCAVGRAAVLVRGASVPCLPQQVLEFWPESE